MYVEAISGGSANYTEFIKGRFADPDIDQTLAYLQRNRLSIDHWVDRCQFTVVLWGWHPSEGNTMAFEHETLKRVFVGMGFNVIWLPVQTDPSVALSKIPGPRIFITGDRAIGAPIAPFAREDDVIIAHNENAPDRWRGILHNYWQYWVPTSMLLGKPAPYPTDLMPHEMSKDWLDQKNDSLAFFVGSAYSPAFQEQHRQLKSLFSSQGIEYEFLETWNCQAIHRRYVEARWIPIPQQPTLTSFLPSRICKGMARGCVPLSINPILEVMLGKWADGCIFGSDWSDVLRQVEELRTDPERLREKSSAAMRWAREQSAFHFLEYLWPAPEKTRPSDAYWNLRSSMSHASWVVQDAYQLEELLQRYPNNRILMHFLGRAYGHSGRGQDSDALARDYQKLFPGDDLVRSWKPDPMTTSA